MNRSYDLVAIGEPLMEFSETMRAGEKLYLPGYGGDTSNAAIAATRQGARVAYVTAVGDDAFGQGFLDLWDREGVNRDSVKVRSDARTGIYFISHGQDGHQFSYYRAGSAASLMGVSDFPKELIESSHILHVSGISQAISVSACDLVFEALRHARSSGTITSYDTNLRLRLWPLDRARAVIHAALALSDIGLPGLDDARQLTGLQTPDDICDAYLALGCRIVALTLGKDGTMVATPAEKRHVPTMVVNAVDATGAGDTFDGAFLAEWRRSGDPFLAARYANGAAALSTQGYGAVAPIPNRPSVEAFVCG